MSRDVGRVSIGLGIWGVGMVVAWGGDGCRERASAARAKTWNKNDDSNQANNLAQITILMDHQHARRDVRDETVKKSQGQVMWCTDDTYRYT